MGAWVGGWMGARVVMGANGGLGGSLCSRDNSVIENMLFVLERAYKP